VVKNIQERPLTIRQNYEAIYKLGIAWYIDRRADAQPPPTAEGTTSIGS